MSHIIWALIPAILWLVAISSRPYFIQSNCAINTSLCIKEGIPALDRLSLGLEDPIADQLSYWTQNFSGALGFLIPPLLSIALYFSKKLTFRLALLLLGSDLILFLQTIAWNGLLTETAHLISHRPRPFVYLDPLVRGMEPAHFTSFYSGHTSFAAASNMAILLMLIHRRVPLVFCILYGLMAEILIFSTAYFRVIAGRHFYTDVLTGILAGTLVALTVGYLYRYKSGLKIASTPMGG